MAKKQILNLIEWTEKATKNFDKDGHTIVERRFKIDTIKNSIDFKAGQLLNELQVRDLLNTGQWEINLRQTRNSDFS